MNKETTLEKLENNYLGKAPANSSRLVATCYELRKKNLKEFTVEDLRIMIGQNMGLKHLIPVALEVLKDNLFAEGDYYEGDLLKSVLTSDKDYWKSNGALKKEVLNLMEKNIDAMENIGTKDEIKLKLLEAYKEFKI